MHTLAHNLPLIIGVAVALGVGFIIGCLFMGNRGDVLAETLIGESRPDASDPWDVQRAIMSASGQELPDWPALTKTSLLYGALNMEELGETLEALADAMRAIPLDNTDSQKRRHIAIVMESYSHHAKELQLAARLIRTRIAGIDDFEVPLTEREAIPLLDGVTDLVVVTAGLANATGLPGAAAYEEVGYSNLSKRNPETGVIDKTPDGKWIKGAKYQPPSLEHVLRNHGAAPLPTA